MKTLRLTLFFLIFTAHSRAEILASINYFKYSLEEHAAGALSSQTSVTSYDLNFQLLVAGRFLVGVTQMTQTMDNGIHSKRETTAPNIGFFLGPLLIEGGPISRAIEVSNLDLAGEWRDGTGYYSGLTLYDRWAGWLLVGFQFTFLNIEYKKYFDGSTELASQSKTVSVMNPSLRLSFLF